MISKLRISLLLATAMFISCSVSDLATQNPSNKWKFVVLSDTHVTEGSDTIVEMIPYIIDDKPAFVLHCGDLAQGGLRATATQLRSEMSLWKNYFQPLIDAGVKIYAVRGNHEDDAMDDIDVWNETFTGELLLPQNGPDFEKNLSYSFTYNNATFICLDVYSNLHKVNQQWLDEQLSKAKNPHVFVFAHEAAFKVFHSDCLDDYPSERDMFWQSMANAGVKAYFCGHDHFYDVATIDDNDGVAGNDIYQFVVGGGGAWLMSKYNYNGDNSYFSPKSLDHKQEHGYLVVEVDGSEVTLIWKGRVVIDGGVEYVPTQKIVKYSI